MNTATPLSLIADLSFDPAQHVIYEGVLVDVPVGRLESGESREFEVLVSFVASGRFSLRSDIRVLGEARGGVWRGELNAIVAQEETSC